MSERVEIIYEAMVRGADKVSDLSQKTKDLGKATEETASKAEKAAAGHKKHEDVLDKSRKAILGLRKEMFLFTFAIGATIGILKGLSANSEALASKLEKVSDKWRDFSTALGNSVANLLSVKGLMASLSSLPTAGFLSFGASNSSKAAQANQQMGESRQMKIQRASLESEIARIQGNNLLSLEKKQYAERIQLEEKFSKDRQAILLPYFEKKWALEREDLRRTELGIESQRRIIQNFQRDLVTGFQSETGNALFNFLEGQTQTLGDVVKSFRTSINRAVSEAISKSAFTAIFSGSGFGGFFGGIKDALMGKSATSIASERTAKAVENHTGVLQKIQDCICRTAENTAGILAKASQGSPGFEGTITPPGVGTLGKIGAIAGGIASLASLGMGGGGGGGSSNSLPANAGISMGQGAFPVGHTGGPVRGDGYIRPYSTGGEVPITAQAGEFIVNKHVAQNNKDFLKSFNIEGNRSKKSGGGGNVYIIKANDAASFEDQLSSPSSRDRMDIQIQRAIMGNGNLRRIIRDFTR